MSDITMTSAVKEVITANTTATRQGRLITGSNIAANAKQLCPVKSGQSRNSIAFGEIDEKTAFASGGTDYFVNFEFGTKNQAAQPTLRPAKDLAQGKNVEEVKRLIIERVAKAALRQKKVF